MVNVRDVEHLRDPNIRADLVCVVAVLLAVAVVYAPAVHFELLNHGDLELLGHIAEGGRASSSWAWSWTTLERGMYQPLTWISHTLDLQRFGHDARGHHLVNLLVHAANSLLVWLVLVRATGRRAPSLAVALLFAVHPLQVQTVAWVAERQGLLATCFGLLALDRYTAAVRHGRWADRAAMHVLLAASLLCKPVLVPLPLVLMVWDLGQAQRALG